MATRAKASTNSNTNEAAAVTIDPADIQSHPQSGEVLDDSTEQTVLPEQEETKTPETAVDTSTDAFESEAVTTDCLDLEGSTESPATTVVVPTPLSRQEAIARINSVNHDVIEVLLPLLSAGGATQKQLAALITRQLGLSESETAALLSHVKQLLETKKQAEGSLIRSLIAEA